ncbi:uncharacterized protein LOC133303874 [Gastrolobium bilobum]|uniref:uncharacterized protein LOC133303874 n=1 Tax=Gastrolobium bilobum TaxID=150636 RepID=UPI002AB0C730|nr:uncharacterized protein LOC133303874 [Gastrolobium bilobum]
MAANENEGLSSKPKRGILHLDNNDAALPENKLLSQQMANLTSRLDKMQLSSVQAKVASVICEYCKEGHESNECPTLLSDNPPQQVHVNGVWYDQRPPPQNVPRNQNFPSGNNNFQRRVQGTGLDFKSNNYLQPPPVQPKEPSDLEKLVGQMAQHSNAFMEETQENTRNTQASIRNLENQIGQLAKQMADRTQGTFPSNTVTNPKEDCMAITTRNGKVVAAPEKPNTNVEADEKLKAVKEPEKEVLIPSDVEKPVQKERFKKDAQKQHYARFLDIFKKLHINIPFAEALASMLNYAKFIKDLLSRKHKLQECQTVALTEKCSAIIQKKFPRKRRDPGSFYIPIVIGNKNVGKTLCDLRASINLMPLSVYKSLGTSELKPTKIFLQLADRSLRKPSDFVVLDMEEGTEMPLLLVLRI